MAMMLECPICLGSLFEECETGNDLQVDESLEDPSTSTDAAVSGGSRPIRGRAIIRAKALQKPQSKTKAILRIPNNEASVTPCGHLFHSRCLVNWFQEAEGQATCPNCRKKIAKTKVTKVFLDTAHSRSFNAGGGGKVSNSAGGSYDTEAFASSSASSGSRDVADLSPVNYTGVSLPDLKYIHSTLVEDFNELKTKYNELRDELQYRDAVIMSLEQEQQNLEKLLQLRDQEEGPTDQNKRKAVISKGTESRPEKRKRN